MDTKRDTAFHGGNNATVVDLAKYKRGLKSAVKKPRRKRAPKFEIVICNCGGSDFKFVLSSDVERLRQRIVCACCAQPVEDESILNTVIELAGGCSR
jgi:hypothetical protein